MHISYETKGICARKIEFDVEEDGKIKNVFFQGGCDGNHKGLANLVEGMDAEDAANRLRGITCGPRNSSCPDQLAQALDQYLSKKQ